MSVRTELKVYGGDRPYSLVVEPWADEFVVRPGDECRLVVEHDTEPGEFGLGHHPDYLTVWVNRGGMTYEFWRNGRREG